MNNCLRNVSSVRFNQLYTIGSRFRYFAVLGIPDSVEVVTESESWDLCGTPVVKVSGRMGGVSVSHLSPVRREDKTVVSIDLPSLTVSEVMLVSGHSREYAEGWVAANDWARNQIRRAAVENSLSVILGGDA